MDGLTRTAAGDVRGVEEGGLWAFLGVPYAADSSGPRRWRRPEPATAWTGVRPADAFRAYRPPASARAWNEHPG